MKYIKTYESIDWDDWDIQEEDELDLSDIIWQIKITPENRPILQSISWGSWEKGYSFTLNAYYGKDFGRMNKQSCREISIEDFMKHYCIKNIKENINWGEEDWEEEDDDIQIGDKVKIINRKNALYKHNEFQDSKNDIRLIYTVDKIDYVGEIKILKFKNSIVNIWYKADCFEVIQNESIQWYDWDEEEGDDIPNEFGFL
jgi:hypothetical protein